MKSIRLTAVLLMVCCYSLFSQTSEDYTALQELLGSEHFQEIQSKSQDRLALMAYMNRHGYYVSDMDDIKDISSYPNALEVPKKYAQAPELNQSLILSDEFNLMAYAFNWQEKDFSYYRIGTGTALLVILPRQEIMKRMNSNNVAE